MWILNCFVNNRLNISISLKIFQTPNPFEMVFNTIDVFANHLCKQSFIAKGLLILLKCCQLEVN